MEPVVRHAHTPHSTLDAGELDCGNGLLLLLRQNLDKLEPGEILEIFSRESSVEADLPAWCRLTNNDLISWTRSGNQRSYLICRGRFDSGTASESAPVETAAALSKESAPLHAGDAGPDQRAGSPQRRKRQPAPVLSVRKPKVISPLSVTGIGSWPRPSWLMPYLHRHLEGKISDDEFESIADDAVRLCVQAQMQAGVDIVTDGEQRRDNYASFVGQRLNGCQLVPLTDLLPLVDDPDKFARELQSLDVPADKVRHPAVTGQLSRRGTLALGELEFLSSVCELPLKVALPGPYLLSRLMWIDCLTDKAYGSREELASDIVKVLREEIRDLFAAGASLVQLDEPVLSEVVFAGAKNSRSFMCGALSERGAEGEELSFATKLINATCAGFPRQQLGLHVCRGNWTPDESVALSGSYERLLPVFNAVSVGTLFLEFCTSRAGDLAVLKGLRPDVRVGLGAVNPKTGLVESVDSIVEKANRCIELLGPDRVLLNPDCGFATFADNPVCSSTIAQSKLAALSQAARQLKRDHALTPG